MKWPSVLRAHRARTFQRSAAFENLRINENRFIVPACADGENDFASRYIRNSISLTMQRPRRMICASHQGGV
jgi:DNA-binding GntR family transcriptional regulator